jgi:hypothetical protein
MSMRITRATWATTRTLIVLATAFALTLGMTVGSALAQSEPDPDLDDLMGGFEDELDDGFDDDFETAEVDEAGDETPAWLARLPFGELIAQRVDLSGSISAGAEYSYLDHDTPHGDEIGRRTDYRGLTRLDLEGFLQLDIQLPYRWKFRGEAVGWYDFSYRINGRNEYGGAVLDVYEWQVDSGEVYLSGPLSKKVDLTLGRKIVNWGRSDTFRVVDVVNPLDNKEPGLVDIEDLRRPRMMAKVDVASGPWSAQFLVIPESRFDRNPPCGSDFFPLSGTRPPGCPKSRIDDNRSDFDDSPGIAGKLDGRFSGWDVSLYGAYLDEPSRVIDFRPTGIFTEANRFGLLGAAGNWTRGPVLLKIEMAWLSDIRVLRSQSGNPIPFSVDKDRIDTMVGIEYYGRDDLTIALEIVNRHLLNEPSGKSTLQRSATSRFESAIRISRPFFRERLNVTALAVGFGERLQNGGLVRLSGDFEITDAWKAEGGIIFYIGGPDDGIGAFDSNDRLYAQIKYSF